MIEVKEESPVAAFTDLYACFSCEIGEISAAAVEVKNVASLP